jgi:hypothetical protein
MHDIGTLDRIRTSQQIARLEAITRPIRTSRSIRINTGRGRMTWSRVKETEEMALKEKHLEAEAHYRSHRPRR